MCIIFVLYQVHPTYPLIIASNRDEFLDRPTESMKLRSSSSDRPTSSSSDVAVSSNNNRCRQDHGGQQQRRRRSSLAGKDLVCGGTWLALDVTSLNIYRDNDDDVTTKSSRPFDSVNNLEHRKDKTDNQANKHNSSSITTPSSSLLRWIAITNYREQEQHGKPSRGGLVTEYISSSQSSAQSFVKELQHKGHEYNGFNFLVGDDMGIYYYGNRNVEQGEAGTSSEDGHDDNTTSTTAESSTTKQPQRLTPGRIYGLSNALLDTPWPKVQRGKELLEQLLHNEQQQQTNNNASNNDNSNETDSLSSLKQFHEKLMTILRDTTQPIHDNELPQTGISLHSERHLSSIFVPVDKFMGKDYGTRTSTSIVVDVHGRVSVLERSWNGGEEVMDEWFQFEKSGIENDDDGIGG